MPELAGFDVIGELAIDTLRDMVNSQPVPLPNGGSAVYLLGGRFMLDVPISLSLLGDGFVQAQCNVTLDAVPRTPNSRLTFTLTDGTVTIASRTVAHINVSIAVTVPIGCIPDPQAGATPNRMVPAILVAFATVAVDCAQLSASNIDGIFGSGTAALVCNSLSNALQTWLQSQQAPIVKAFGFNVVPGIDSAKPEQLSAVPQVLWINEETLCVFGFYRADATGGNVFLKTESDIVQTQEEFVYNQPGIFSTLPARRVAVLLSPTGFQRVVGCPLVRDGVISGLIADAKRSYFIEQVRAQLGKQFFIEEYHNHFSTYFFEEQQKNPDDLIGDYNRATDRIQVDADNQIKAESEKRLIAWLATPDGQTAIIDATPPPCGNGSIVAKRQHMPDPFGDVVATLTFFGVTLANGSIALDAKAGGDLPICGSFTVDQTGKIYVEVDAFSTIHPSTQMDEATTDISTNPLCAIASGILIGVFTGITWGVALSFLAFAVAGKIGENAIAQAIAEHPPNQPKDFTPSLPSNSRILDVQIDPTGIRTLGLIGRVIRINDFRPRIDLTVVQIDRVPAGPPTYNSMSVQATKWGCPAATFDYIRQHYDTTFQVRLNAVDLPLPITVIGWQLEIGNFSFNLGIRDPRPNWSGDPVPITVPTTTLTGGRVWRPEPPLHGFFEPQDVTTKVTGSAETGWTLQFSGLDSYFYVRVAVTVTDGDGNQQTDSTFLVVDGDDIAFGDDYGAWKDDCNRKYRAYLATLHFMQIAQVPPGESVQNIETLVAMVIREAIRVGNPGAYSQLSAAVEQYGEQMLGRVGTAPALPTASLPKSE